MPRVDQVPVKAYIDNLVREMLPSYEELELIPGEVQNPDTPPEDEVTQTLRKMRTLLESNWVSGRMDDGDGNHCLIGGAQYMTMGVAHDYTNLGAFPVARWADRGGPSTSRYIVAAPIVFMQAIIQWAGTNRNKTYRKTIRALKRQAGKFTVAGLWDLNDEKGKDTVLRLIDSTIESRTR